jgi:urea ABC transporter permease protein UrtB
MPSGCPLIEKALAGETDGQVRALLERSLGQPAGQRRPAAASEGRGATARQQTPETQLLLNQRLSEESDPGVQKAIKAALAGIEESLAWGDRLGAAFSGISLGSVLLLAALGLAITYGLMGVINMAHGELMMIGAYATYLVQVAFQRWLPEAAFGWYLVVALPGSSGRGAGGAVLERGVIRFLYGRPLETLLATFGISLVLQQTVRSLFGAQNVGVENPVWMSGGIALLPNLTLPYNRIAIIVFAFAVLAGVAFMIARTRLGLFVRGVTQNRAMASCVGVNTARTDTYAFALGWASPVWRLRPEPDRQCGPGSGAELHRGQFPGGGAGRCGPAGGHRLRGSGPGRAQQAAGRLDRRRAGQDRRAAVHRGLHSKASARHLCLEGPQCGNMKHPESLRAFPCRGTTPSLRGGLARCLVPGPRQLRAMCLARHEGKLT